MDTLLETEGRAPGDLKRSAMMGTLLARDADDLREQLSGRGRTLEEIQSRGLIAGTPDQWVEQLRAYRDAGLQRIMLQWINQDDVQGIGIVAREVLPHV